jgi:hypothetical protein
LPSLNILNIPSNGINVTKMYLESDRTDQIDPLASVRSGDDWDDDETISKVSDHMSQINNQVIDFNNIDSPALLGLGASFGSRKDSGDCSPKFLNMLEQPQTERRNTVNHGSMGRPSVDLRGPRASGLSASAINPKMGLFRKVGDAFKVKNSKLMKDLD